MIENYVDKYGFFAVLILRILFFIPYNLQNAAFGLSSVKISSYLLASLSGILPVTVLYSYIGGTLSSGISSSEGNKNALIILTISGVLTAVVFITGFLLKRSMEKRQKRRVRAVDEMR